MCSLKYHSIFSIPGKFPTVCMFQDHNYFILIMREWKYWIKTSLEIEQFNGTGVVANNATYWLMTQYILCQPPMELLNLTTRFLYKHQEEYALTKNFLSAHTVGVLSENSAPLAKLLTWLHERKFHLLLPYNLKMMIALLFCPLILSSSLCSLDW